VKIRIPARGALPPAIHYALETILRVSGLFFEQGMPEPGEIAIHYTWPGRQALRPGSIYILPSDPEGILELVRKGDGKPLPSRREGESVVVEQDILGLSAFLLTLQEEIGRERDRHDRFSGRDSIRSNGLLRTPLVNTIASGLLAIVQEIATRMGVALLRKCNAVHGRPFAVALTHDVDAFDIARPEVYCFDRIDRGEGERGVRSSFNFCMTSGKGYHPENGYWDPHYKVTDPGFRETLSGLRDRGFEVGLHGSYDSGSYRDPQSLRNEKRRLEELLQGPVYGGRQHYLRFSATETWKTHEQCGMLYDSTLGYHDRLGYRAGIGVPFRPFDGREGGLALWELPLLIMDGTVFDTEPELNTLEKRWNALEGMLTRLSAVNGCCAVLWHQRVFAHPAHTGWGDFYWRILDWVKDRDGFMGPGREIVEEWEAMSSVQMLSFTRRGEETSWELISPHGLENLTLMLDGVDGHAYDLISTIPPERLVLEGGKISIARLREGERFTITARIPSGRRDGKETSSWLRA
jgi:hypothetical protein